MSYFNEIDTHMKNVFSSEDALITLEKLPSQEELEKMDMNKLYKVQFSAINVDIVGFKKLNDHTDPEVLNKIMSEFFYGVTKILKAFNANDIDIQGDGCFATFGGGQKSDIDNTFRCACALNTFKKHLNKVIDMYFPNELKNNHYSSTELEFGIGIWQSWENFISKVGHGKTRELIYMGDSVNKSSAIAKIAARNGRKSILMNDLINSNFTDEQKKKIEEQGGLHSYYDYNLQQTIYECDWIMSNYNNFVDNNV